MQVVERLQDISSLLDAAQDAAVHGNIMHALERLEDADGAFGLLEAFESTRVVGVLKNRADQLKAALVETVTESWNALLVVDVGARRVSFKETIDRKAITSRAPAITSVARQSTYSPVTGDTPMHIDTVVEALQKLDLFESSIVTLARSFDRVIVSPRLAVGKDQVVSSFVVEGDDIQVDGHMRDMQVQTTLEDIHVIAEFLSTRLPPTIAVPLSAKLVPVIANRLISNWLLPAVPLSTDGVPQFQATLSFVLGLADYLDELDWSGQDRLREWVDKSAEIWLAKQKEAAIARVHALCPKRVRDKRKVERVETQMVAKDDAMLGQQDQEDQEEDWGQDWGEEEPAEEPAEEEKAPGPEVEEEDMSAWDDEEEQKAEPEPPKKGKLDKNDGADDEEDVDAWGWGDDADEADQTQETDTKPAPAAAAKAPAPAPAKENGNGHGHSHGNGHGNGKAPVSQQQGAKEVTLRETYTVTAIPDAIMEIIQQVVSDVHTLNEPSLAGAAITPASPGLYAIPRLLLAMYRATASSHYAKDSAPNMLIYNDCSRLSDRIRAFLNSPPVVSSPLPPHLHPATQLESLKDDIAAIEAFGKRAYGREMESQRTIIRDLLDGAQGFTSCTTPPYASECDAAIAITIDRIEEISRLWSPTLSHSALLQSLGSLLSTALQKFISDVQDLSDISEPESAKLHSFCESLGSLGRLFITKDEGGEEREMVSVYTPAWFRFQYLGEVLVGSLADIRYLWSEGGLKLEMEAEEVVDLIRALFAESEFRRKAISEIRRTSVVR